MKETPKVESQTRAIKTRTIKKKNHFSMSCWLSFHLSKPKKCIDCTFECIAFFFMFNNLKPMVQKHYFKPAIPTNNKQHDSFSFLPFIFIYFFFLLFLFIDCSLQYSFRYVLLKLHRFHSWGILGAGASLSKRLSVIVANIRVAEQNCLWMGQFHFGMESKKRTPQQSNPSCELLVLIKSSRC